MVKSEPIRGKSSSDNTDIHNSYFGGVDDVTARRLISDFRQRHQAVANLWDMYTFDDPAARKATNVKIRIEINEATLKQLVAEYLDKKLGDLSPKPANISIRVKSKQNYKSEWEEAEFQAVYEEHK